MSGSVDRQVDSRPSSITFLRTVAILSLVLAGAEILLALHYRRESERNVAEKFQELYYGSGGLLKTRRLGVPSQQAPTGNWSMQENFAESPPYYIILTGAANCGDSLLFRPAAVVVKSN